MKRTPQDIELPIRSGRIHVRIYGEGASLMVALHGFGENSGSFSLMDDSFGGQYTIAAIDLPFHGATRWMDSLFAPEDLEMILHKLLASFHQKSLSLLGYSMGGRLALCLTQRMPGKINRLILLAPDGLKNNPWHLFATHNFPGRALFKYITYRPGLFFASVRALGKTGLLNESVVKFTYNQMDTPAKRLLLYHTWSCMKEMMPDLKKIKKRIRQHQIPVLLLLGKYDRMIPPRLGTRMSTNLPGCEVICVEKGHHLLVPEVISILQKKLREK